MKALRWLGVAAVAIMIAGCLVAPGPVVVRQPPPPPPAQVEVIAVQPGPAYVWVPGHWAPHSGGYVWVEGHWRLR